MAKTKHLRLPGFLTGGLLLMAAASGALAQSDQALENLLAPYPRAEVVEQAENAVVDYPLATGAMRKVSGRWAPEQALRRSGQLARVTMQIPEGDGAQEAFRHYRERLAALNASAIFLCRERNCGSSNSWANDQFQIKQLYGLDQEQYYGIFELVDDQDQLNYFALYTVRRGNQRVYAHLELLQTEASSAAGVAPNPDAIIEQLREQGYYRLSGLRLEGGELLVGKDHLAALAKALGSNRRLSLRIVGHDYGPPPEQTQMERSLRYASALKQALVKAGVDEDRLQVHGVGSLVPLRLSSGEREANFRLELVPTADR